MASSVELCDSIKIKKYLSENKQDLSQVYAVHKKSLEIIEEEITQWKKFIKDYNVLQETLTTYPDKTSYEDVIPIGSLAFMKGRKIHTNEVLVHLGENWFAERSVKDTIPIIIRRTQVCEEKLKVAERTKEIHEGWMKQTQDLAEEGEQIEILEDVSEEDYQKSKEKHKEMLLKHLSMMGEKDQENINEAGDSAINDEIRNFEDLLRKLDALEEEERIQDKLMEMEEYNEEENGVEDGEASKGDDQKSGEKEGGSSPSGKEKLRRRVSWADQLTEPKHDDDDEDDDEEEGPASSETLRMKYRSRQQSLPTELIASSWNKDETSPSQENVDDEEVENEETEESPEEDAEHVTPQSPSDLYKMFGPHSIGGQPTKGILKKKGDSFQADETEKGVGWLDTAESIEYIPCSPDEPVVFRNPPLSESPKEIKNLKPAFSYKVVARDEKEDEAMKATPETPTDEEEPKRISRFKAGRMKKGKEES